MLSLLFAVYQLSWSFILFFFFFSSRRRHTRYWRDWSSDVCSSDLLRNEFKFCGRATVLLEVASAARPLARSSQTCRGALAATRRSFESWARTLQLQAHNL